MRRSTSNLTPILRRLLRPALRFCIRRSVKFQDLIGAAKLEMVALAQQELRDKLHSSSISRLSVMTGLQRKDLRSLIAEGRETRDVEGSSRNLIFRVICRWSQDKKFTRSDGKPRVLSCAGLESEFADLLRGVSSDLNHHTVLFELERLGLIRKEGSRAQLLTSVYSNQRNADEALADATQDLDDLYQAVEENISADNSDVHLHGRTYYDNIAPSEIPRIKAWIFQKGVEFHKQIRTFLKQFDRDLSATKRPATQERSRVVVGTFSYAERVSSTAEEDSNE